MQYRLIDSHIDVNNKSNNGERSNGGAEDKNTIFIFISNCLMMAMRTQLRNFKKINLLQFI